MSPFLKATPPSASFLRHAARLAETGHENRLTETLRPYGLLANIPLTYVDVGLKDPHPVQTVVDFVKTLDAHGKMDMILMGHRADSFKAFWDDWRKLHPSYPIFSTHVGLEGQCIPWAMHFDEGTTLKKKAIMIIQTQPLMGQGTRKRKGTIDSPGLNFLGHSLTTRFLWSVMLSRVYSGKRLQNKPLLTLVSHLAKDMASAYKDGIRVTIDGAPQRIYLIPIGAKGDWPALAKVGTLSRHYGRQARQDGKGICHLCCADQAGFKHWHNVSFDSMKAMRTAELPWKKEPCILSALPLVGGDKADFFKADCFHNLHKGVMGDLAANALAFWRMRAVDFRVAPLKFCSPEFPYKLSSVANPVRYRFAPWSSGSTAARRSMNFSSDVSRMPGTFASQTRCNCICLDCRVYCLGMESQVSTLLRVFADMVCG